METAASQDSADIKPNTRTSSLRGSAHPNDGGFTPVQSPRGQRSLRKAILRRNSAKSNTQQTNVEVASNPTDPYGYEDPDSIQVGSNRYGYEDPNTSVQNKSPNPTNLYGYGDANDPQVEQPPRRRATRRGSVTKFSLDAAKVVVSSEHGCEPQRMVVDHLDQHPCRASPTGPNSTTKPTATTKESMMQAPEFTMRRSQLLNLSRSPYFASENRSYSKGADDSLSDSEPESSDIDSVASFGDDDFFVDLADDTKDAPKVPRRVDSIESDASSLAPDLRSYCSISGARDEEQDIAPPPPPIFLPHTPTPTNTIRKSPITMTPKVVARSYSREGLCQQNSGKSADFRETFNRNSRCGSFNTGGVVPLVTFPDVDQVPLSKSASSSSLARRFARRGAV